MFPTGKYSTKSSSIHPLGVLMSFPTLSIASTVTPFMILVLVSDNPVDDLLFGEGFNGDDVELGVPTTLTRHGYGDDDVGG